MDATIDIGTDPHGTPVPIDVEELLATRLLVQGNSGSGKSHLLRRLLEQSAHLVQQVVIDPEGDFTSLADFHDHVVIEGGKYSVREIEACGGGYVAVAAGELIEACPLPVAGIMSDQPWETVRTRADAVDAAAAALGCTIHAPFMIMAFIGLAGVPDLGLTERGLIDVATQSFCDVVLTEQLNMVCCRCPSHAHDVHRVFDPRSSEVSP